MKNIGTRKLLISAACIFGFLALIMYCLPVLRLDFEYYGDSLNGFTVGFGAGENEYAASAYMLAFLLPLIGAVLVVLSLCGIGGNLLNLIAAVCFLVGGIIFFLPFQTVSWTDLSGEATSSLREVWKEMYHVSFGAILGGICSLTAAIFASAPSGLKLLGISLD